MLLNLGTPEPTKNALKPQNWMAAVAGLMLVIVIASAIMAIPQPSSPTMLPRAMSGAFEIGLTMFSPTWLFPFEAVSILLLIAVVGAVVLAKRRLS
jgi:NADH-quinone oxidoreductase subunit J